MPQTFWLRAMWKRLYHFLAVTAAGTKCGALLYTFLRGRRYRGLPSVKQSGHVTFQLLESRARIKSVPVAPSFPVIVDSEAFPTFGAEL